MELEPSALPNGKTTSEPSTSSSHSSENGEPSASVCEEAESYGGCEKAGEGDTVGDEGSESNGNEAVLTDAMLKEEQQLQDGESRENSTERDKVVNLRPLVSFSLSYSLVTYFSLTHTHVQLILSNSHPLVRKFTSLSLSLLLSLCLSFQVTELRGMVEHQRFLRLQHLLERSTIYSRFMLKQMEDQRDREKKEEEKNARQKKNTNKSSKEKVNEVICGETLLICSKSKWVCVCSLVTTALILE